MELVGKIKDISPNERPREKAIKYGLESLDDIELLALILGSGTSTFGVLDISSFILNQYKTLNNFALENYKGLSSIKGIKKSKTLLLLAIFEFHKRVLKEAKYNVLKIDDGIDVYNHYFHLATKEQEVLVLLLLNKKNELIKEVELYKGSKSSIEVNVREIITQILIGQGEQFILVHNHPSGDYFPSKDDIILTREIARKAESLEIVLFDHIIITSNGFYSFKAHEKMFTKKKDSKSKN